MLFTSVYFNYCDKSLLRVPEFFWLSMFDANF